MFIFKEMTFTARIVFSGSHEEITQCVDEHFPLTSEFHRSTLSTLSVVMQIQISAYGQVALASGEFFMNVQLITLFGKHESTVHCYQYGRRGLKYWHLTGWRSAASQQLDFPYLAEIVRSTAF